METQSYLFGNYAEPTIGHPMFDESPSRIARRIPSSNYHKPERFQLPTDQTWSFSFTIKLKTSKASNQ